MSSIERRCIDASRGSDLRRIAAAEHGHTEVRFEYSSAKIDLFPMFEAEIRRLLSVAQSRG